MCTGQYSYDRGNGQVRRTPKRALGFATLTLITTPALLPALAMTPTPSPKPGSSRCSTIKQIRIPTTSLCGRASTRWANPILTLSRGLGRGQLKPRP